MEIYELEPQNVWRNFYSLTQIPRPSGHTEKVAQFLVDFAKKNGAEAFIDNAGNVVMRKKATAGYENRKTAILQAHMDMVPQKAKDSNHNFEQDPIQTYIDGEWVKAKGTTLGSDNGMGVAAAMSIIEDTTLEHGPIEVTIGCAGGMDVVCSMEYQEINVNKEGMQAYKIDIKGLRGGHSGLEINEGRANANKLMARLLFAAVNTGCAWLCSWHGGNMRNAIPRDSEAVVLVPQAKEEEFKALVEKSHKLFNEEFDLIENGNIHLSAEKCDAPEKAVPEDVQENLINAVMAAHDGVLRMTPSIPEVVETSSNLAIISIDGGKAEIAILARSSRNSMKLYLCNSLMSCFSMAGMKVKFEGGYDGWQPNTKSELVKLMSNVYSKMFGNEPKIQVCHAGLECGIIGATYTDMDMASFGPTLMSPHTPDERCLIPTVGKFYNYVTEILKNIPEE